jgi:hypothetical protein
METITDKLNREAMGRMLDLVLVKRQAARRYIRKRHALRTLVKLGVFTPEQARREQSKLAELMATWRAARVLLADKFVTLVYHGTPVKPGAAHFNATERV